MTDLNYKKTTRIIEAFIDPSARIGARSLVWHYSVIMAGVVIGDDCSVGARTEIGKGSSIGHFTRIGSGVFLPYHSRVGCSVFIGPNVTCTDDKHPKILDPGESYTAQPPIIEDYVSIGAAAVILPGGAGGEAYLACHPNFLAIRRYNPSDFYCISVGLIGERVTA